MIKIINLIEDTPGSTGCLYEHGLSFYIETEKGVTLMDTGASGAFAANAKTLGADLTKVDTVVLSHGHYDHTGGLLAFLEINKTAPFYIRSSADGDFYNMKDEGPKYIGVDRRILDSSRLVLVEGNRVLDEERSLFTGITGGKFIPSGNRRLTRKESAGYEPDTFEHEQCLVVQTEGRSFLFSGCAHNGILNILDRYREIYGGVPDAIISGFHMMKKDAYTDEETRVIRETARTLKAGGALCFTGHCTGDAAFDIMKDIMGDKLRRIHSGDTLAWTGSRV